MSVSLSQAEKVVLYAPEQDCVVLASPPGTGKSSIVVRAAKRAGAIYVPYYAATMEAVDARGLPYTSEVVHEKESHRIVKWAAPSFLPLAMMAKQYPSDAHFIVNFDDWFQAPPPVLRATVRSIYGDGCERKVGEFPLFSRVRFVATGNREQDRAGVYRPETYVNDRITYIECEPSVDDWVAGAIQGFAAPPRDEDYADQRAAINKAVAKGVPDELVAYIRWSKQVYDFSVEQRSFLSPRSIERLGRFIRAFDAVGINGELLHEVACGTIGEAHAVKYMAFHKLRDELPDVDALLKGEEVPLPGKSEVLFVLATAIIRAGKKEHVAAVAKLIDRMSKVRSKGGDGMAVGVEVSAYLFGECLRGSAQELRGLRSQPSMMKWLQEYGSKYFV